MKNVKYDKPLVGAVLYPNARESEIKKFIESGIGNYVYFFGYAKDSLLFTSVDDETIEFTGQIFFDSLTAATDLHPAGYEFDEAVLAACLARAEMDGADLVTGRIEYYQKVALPKAYDIDAKTRPRKAGKLRQCTGRRNVLPAYRMSNYRVYHDSEL